MMRGVCGIKPRQLEVIIKASIDVVSESWDRVRNLPDPDSSPQFVLFIHSEACERLSAEFLCQA